MRAGLRFLASLPSISMGLAATPVLACNSCFDASSPGTRLGYYVSTAILSLTPLLIMGLMGSYLAYKYSRHARRRGPAPAVSEALTELAACRPQGLRGSNLARIRGSVLRPRHGREGAEF